MTDKQDNHRQSLRLKEYDYSQAGAYFVTICTQDRACLLGEIVDGEMRLSEVGLIVKSAWDKLPQRYPEVELDAYVIMPNHIHAIIVITNVGAIHELPLPPNNPMHRRRMLIPKIIGYAKMNTAKRINQSRNTPGTRIWQRNYYEHIIRNEAELAEVQEYIFNNPIHWNEDENNPDLRRSWTGAGQAEAGEINHRYIQKNLCYNSKSPTRGKSSFIAKDFIVRIDLSG